MVPDDTLGFLIQAKTDGEESTLLRVTSFRPAWMRDPITRVSPDGRNVDVLESDTGDI